MFWLIPRIPWRQSPRPTQEGRSPIDYLLQPAFAVSYACLSFTFVRLLCAVFLVPAYLVLAFYRSVWPFLMRRGFLLATADGRRQLLKSGERNSVERLSQGRRQFQGEYVFDKGTFAPGWCESRAVDNGSAAWAANRRYFSVCGLRACVVHEKPVGTPRRTLVLLHGNPSWSYMYRNIIGPLVSQGFEVFALDWIGFGGSDKPLSVEEISFELHMRTLLNLFETYQIRHACVLAHDWGGCVALCTMPHFSSKDACEGVMLLNSFFPPRASDVSWNAYLLYLLWLSAQGILANLVPEQAIIRYMAPSVTQTIATGYATPFPSPQSKAAVTRFARLVPGMPPCIYRWMASPLGQMMDGLCPSNSLSSLQAQACLRRRDEEARRYWGSGQMQVRAGVIFGDRDTLLGDFYSVLCQTVRTRHGGAVRHLVVGGGHYAAEEQPEKIVELFGGFAGGEKSVGGEEVPPEVWAS